MMTTKKVYRTARGGFTLLITVITISIVLAIGMSILNITLKEMLLSGATRDSEMAFYAADAGLECARYYDQSKNDGNKFRNFTGSITCMGDSESVNAGNVSGGNTVTTNLEFGWGDPAVCARVTVEKYTCASSSAICTSVTSSGYNRACNRVGSDPRVVERTLHSSY